MSGYQHNKSLECDSGNKKTTINNLPSETLLSIFSFLKTSDVSACFRTCKWWRDLISESETLWKIQCLSLNESRTQVHIDRRNGCTWKVCVTIFLWDCYCNLKYLCSTVHILLFALTLYQTTKFLDWSKLKAFADDQLNWTEKLKFVLGKVENIAPFLTVFSKGFFSGSF